MLINRSQVLVFLTVACISMSANAEYYRWIDKNGEIHYGDHVPAEETKQGRDKLNAGGRVVESVERAKTAEELKTYQEQQRLADIKRQKSGRTSRIRPRINGDFYQRGRYGTCAR